MFQLCMDFAQTNLKKDASEDLPSSSSMHLTFEFEFDFHYIDDTQSQSGLQMFHKSGRCSRSSILSDYFGPDVLFFSLTNMVPRIRSLPCLTETLLVSHVIPRILSFARETHAAPVNRGRQVLKLSVKLLARLYDEEDEVIAASLSRSSIQAIKRSRYVDDDAVSASNKRSVEQPTAENNQKNCRICLDEFADGEEIASIPCGHAYHERCIVKWLHKSRNRNCPLCRYQMPS